MRFVFFINNTKCFLLTKFKKINYDLLNDTCIYFKIGSQKCNIFYTVCTKFGLLK